MKTIFSNENFIIVDKPSGWLSVDSRDPKDPRPCAGRKLEEEMVARGESISRVWPCHRLDAEVSGILIFARNSEAHRAANNWFEKHLVQKTYEAFSEPVITESIRIEITEHLGKTQIWKSNITRGKRRSYETEFGKEAITRTKFLGEFNFLGIKNCLHWQLEPLTGRPHQLRFELYKHQSPILGDELYGAQIKYPNVGIALRAFHVKFLDKHRTMWGLPEEFQIEGLPKN